MFLLGVLVPLGLKHLEGADQFRPRHTGLNHFIYEASLGRHVGSVRTKARELNLILSKKVKAKK